MTNTTPLNAKTPNETEIAAIVAELPTSYRTRWSAGRKAAVVRAVQAGALSLGKALDRYRLSRSEFSRWQFSYAQQGQRGLSARELQHHR